MVQSAILGFPRMGVNRDLKKATEAYWGGKISQADLLAEAKRLRLAHWKIQQDAGVDVIPSNDFALYDQVLHQIQDFGAVPERYTKDGLDPIDQYFAMGRGHQKEGVDVPSLEMVKWFDSNYHYVKPTLQDNQTFKLTESPKAVNEYKEAKEAGISTRPVLVGPVSFLHLGKADRGQSVEPIDLLEKLLPVYEQLLTQLKEAGAETVQIDEPVLVFDLPAKTKAAFKPAYEKFASLGDKIPKLVFTTYFGDIVHNLDLLPKDIYGVHIDLVRNPEQLEKVLGALGPNTVLSAGVVDGRNIWKTNLKRAIETVETAIQKLGKDRVIAATSSSLLHTPHTLASEKKLDAEIADWFSFATEKASEIALIAKAVTEGPAAVREQLEANAKSMQARATSTRTNDPKVKDRQSKITEQDYNRKNEFPERISQQQKKLNLPLFPTTTIGSFPQTKEIRVQRNKYTKGEITLQEYDRFIEKEIEDNVKIQEELGLDVFVHGEPERNDMVQFFGERLDGYAFTTHAWVQSYGSRCVRPPIIVGDISRPAPMTVKESKYAVSVSKKPMKGMLTGPVTCLRWSFPRDDVHQSVQAEQLALALRDEVVDLEKAGVDVIQVDEPALREGLPLRSGEERDAYLKWAVKAFRLSTAGVEDSTQIHSHFCYSEFQDFFHAIAALDADVLSIENSKSDAKLLRVFVDSAYPRHIGPGVYDIHSPRVPSEQEIKDRIEEMLQFLKPEQLWIDPDCGLKTRQWKETKEALINMVNAAKYFRTNCDSQAVAKNTIYTSITAFVRLLTSMPPIIILDSDDDEDHSYSPERGPQAPIAPAEAESTGTHSSGRVSRATTSTDPSFFQNVYDEQNDAARGYVPEGTNGSPDRDRISSSEMTAPAPFKRTVTGLIEPSSHGPDEWTQASTPGRKKAPTAVMDDPWDVPSSPEADRRHRVTKIRIKRKQPPQVAQPVSKIAQDFSGRPYESNPAPGHGVSEGSPSGRRKRRKKEYSELSQQGSNEVDLVTIPLSNDMDGEQRESQPEPTPSMLPPTLPVNEDVSFYIAAKPLTDTQKMEYDSVHLTSSDSHDQPLPPIYQFNIQKIDSSGSATNVNTPRSNATCLMSTAPPPSSVMGPTRTTAERFTGQRWDSSPDIIAGVESPTRTKETTQREEPRQRRSVEPVAGEVTEVEKVSRLETELSSVETTAIDNNPEAAEPPTKTKKARGRPKKKAVAETTQSTDQTPPHPIDAEKGTKPKKKRGRPRKADQPAKEKSPQVEKLPSPNDNVSSADEASHSETKPEAQLKLEETKANKAHAEREASPVEDQIPSNHRAVLKESSPNTVTEADTNLEEKTPSKPSNATNPAKKEGQKEENPAIASKGTTPSKGLSALLNKPVYRVGLSKRSRIAPLLKCLRK
ncbi:hypothetical protein FDECE_11893 [Fusarium decemcellulare]|nr:hypothetical protein FDECE_11893 [Fusarium decemcellulare]